MACKFRVCLYFQKVFSHIYQIFVRANGTDMVSASNKLLILTVLKKILGGNQQKLSGSYTNVIVLWSYNSGDHIVKKRVKFNKNNLQLTKHLLYLVLSVSTSRNS